MKARCPDHPVSHFHFSNKKIQGFFFLISFWLHRCSPIRHSSSNGSVSLFLPCTTSRQFPTRPVSALLFDLQGKPEMIMELCCLVFFFLLAGLTTLRPPLWMPRCQLSVTLCRSKSTNIISPCLKTSRTTF